MAVLNTPERKLAKCTSVQWRLRDVLPENGFPSDFLQEIVFNRLKNLDGHISFFWKIVLGDNRKPIGFQQHLFAFNSPKIL